MTKQSEPETFLGLTEQKALILILIIAVILRVIGANSELWFDEIATVVNFVRLPLGTLVHTYASANNHVLNSVLSHVSVEIFRSEQPWVVRLPAIVFGIGGVWAFYLVACQLWRSQVVLIGTFMFAVSYHDVFYTQQARGYSAFLFFELVATGLLLRMVLTPDRDLSVWYGLGYALAIGFGGYSLLLMTFVIMGHGSILLITRRWKVLCWLLAGILVALILYAPMLSSLIQFHIQEASIMGVPFFSRAFFVEIRPILPTLITGIIVLPFAVTRLWKRVPLAAAILIAPVVFNIVVPVVRGEGVHPRYLIYGLPLAYLFLTELLDWARQYFRWIPALAAAALTVVSLVALVRYYSVPKQGFRQALAYVADHRMPDDKTIGLSYGGKAGRFYDPSVVLIENSDQLQEWLKGARNNTWVLYSFENEMRRSDPKLYNWVVSATINEERFPSAIGDGSIYVRLWIPN